MTAREAPNLGIAAWEKAAANAREAAAWWGPHRAATMESVLTLRATDGVWAAHELRAFLRERDHAARMLWWSAHDEWQAAQLRALAKAECSGTVQLGRLAPSRRPGPRQSGAAGAGGGRTDDSGS